MPEAGIRGHHLDYLLQIDKAHMACEQAGYSPYESRAIAESQVRDWMKDVLWNMSAMAEQDPENRDTYIDIVGKDRTMIPSIANSFTSALMGLYRLKQGEVQIHADKDGICNACAIGGHCQEDTYDHEMQYMRDVMRVANRLELPYTLNTDSTVSMEPEHLRAVLRNMNQQETEFTYSQSLEM